MMFYSAQLITVDGGDARSDVIVVGRFFPFNFNAMDITEILTMVSGKWVTQL